MTDDFIARFDRIDKMMNLIATHTVPGFVASAANPFASKEKPTAETVTEGDFVSKMATWDAANPDAEPWRRQDEVNRLLGMK